MALVNRFVRLVALSIALGPLAALAQQPAQPAQPAAPPAPPAMTGAPIGVEVARKAGMAAVAEAKKNGWRMAVAVVDAGGWLTYFERIDGLQGASSSIAIAKAKSAMDFKRPTKVFEDRVKSGDVAVLGLTGAFQSEGGIPIVIDGVMVGAIGCSGGASSQDGVCAKAGADAVTSAAAKR